MDFFWILEELNWPNLPRFRSLCALNGGWASGEASQIQELCEGSRNSWISQNSMIIFGGEYVSFEFS